MFKLNQTYVPPRVFFLSSGDQMIMEHLYYYINDHLISSIDILQQYTQNLNKVLRLDNYDFVSPVQLGTYSPE